MVLNETIMECSRVDSYPEVPLSESVKSVIEDILELEVTKRSGTWPVPGKYPPTGQVGVKWVIRRMVKNCPTVDH